MSKLTMADVCFFTAAFVGVLNIVSSAPVTGKDWMCFALNAFIALYLRARERS